MKEKYTIGLTLYEMAKQNCIDVNALRAFAHRLDNKINIGTPEADFVEEKLYFRPLNKKQKRKNAKRVEMLSCLCKILGSMAREESRLADLVDYYFKLYGDGAISQKVLFENIKLIREIEARVLMGEDVFEVIDEYGKESLDDLRKDKEFYDLAFMRGTINKKEHAEMMAIIKNKRSI